MRTRPSGARLGALVAAVGGLSFVLANAGGLPGPWSWVVQGLGAALFGLTLGRLRRPDVFPAGPRPSAQAWRVYGLSVGLMVLSFPLGAWALRRAGLEEAMVLWVIFVVGLHFWPFARAFGAPVFRPLAWSLAAVALVGLGAALAGWAWAPAGAAVLAGSLLLSFSGGWLGQAHAGAAGVTRL